MVCDTLRDSFAAQLPELNRLAKTYFRHLTPDRREEAIQNTLTLVWKHYRSLALNGRGEEPLLRSILWYAVKQTRCGRMIQGGKNAKGVADKQRWGKVQFDVVELEGLVGRNTSVLDRVSFRIDMPQFFDTLTDRQRRLACDLAWGMTTKEAADKYGVTPGAISQFRVRFKLLFDNFFATATV